MEYLSEKDFLLAFGENLRRVRKSKGFTQAQLANDLGVEISQISRMERGIISTSISNVNKIARVLNVPLIDFFKFHQNFDQN